jgi:molybdopterin molybdotransferase
MGKHDFILPALRDLGAHVRFHKVAMRPGKPIAFAEFEGSPTVFFGLPGNPVSTAVGLRFFVEPYLRMLLGRTPLVTRILRLEATTRKPEGLRCFLKGVVDWHKGTARVLAGQSSALVSPLLEANAWVILDAGRAEYTADSHVEVVALAEGDSE